MSWRRLWARRKHRPYHVSCLNRVWHGLLLRRPWHEDGMWSVDSSTWAHTGPHWPHHCTSSGRWRCHADHREVRHLALWQDKHLTRCQQGTLQAVCYEEQSPADTTNKCGPQAACPTSHVTGRACSGPGTASCTSIALPDLLGLGQDERADVRAPLDNTPWGIRGLPGARLLQMPEGLHEEVQVQECKAGMHTTMCMWWGVLSELNSELRSNHTELNWSSYCIQQIIYVN